MRLAVWCSSYFKGFGGVEKVVNDLLNRFAELGIDTYLIANSFDQKQTNNIHYERLNPKVTIYQNTFSNPFDYLKQPLIFILRLFRYFKAAVQLWGFLRRNQIQIIHLHFVSFDALLLAAYRFFMRYKFIITFAGSDIEAARTELFARLKVKIALRCADGVTAVSQDLCDTLKTSYGFSKALYIPNGINTKRIRQSTSVCLAGVREDNFVYCGRLVSVKRVPFLVEAFHRCIKQGCAKDLYLIGDGEEAGRIQALIAAYGMGTRIVSLGALTHAQALGVIHRSRCLLLSSSSEGCPLVALEALALGRPIIAPNVGGLKEIVTDGENGYLYPFDRQDILCDLIMAIANNEDLPAKMGAKGPMTIAGKFEFDAVINRYLHIYDSMGRDTGRENISSP